MGSDGKMNRRTFLQLSAAGVAAAGAGAWLLNSFEMFGFSDSAARSALSVPQSAKKVFARCGACSHSMFHLVNREFGHPHETAELASDPLAGGLMNTQHQCGMVWGAVLGMGAAAWRNCDTPDQAIETAMTGAQRLVSSFQNRAHSLNCRDVVGFDMHHGTAIASFMIKGLPSGMLNMVCFNLMEHWYPEAVQVIRATVTDARDVASREGNAESLVEPTATENIATLVVNSGESIPAHSDETPVRCRSCASEVARRMGATDEEKVTVAGLAGGIGLSGQACGALGAAIWIDSLHWCRENSGQSGYLNPRSEEILTSFHEVTGSEMLCSRICGQQFTSHEEHTAYMDHGGCEELISALAQA